MNMNTNTSPFLINNDNNNYGQQNYNTGYNNNQMNNGYVYNPMQNNTYGQYNTMYQQPYGQSQQYNNQPQITYFGFTVDPNWVDDRIAQLENREYLLANGNRSIAGKISRYINSNKVITDSALLRVTKGILERMREQQLNNRSRRSDISYVSTTWRINDSTAFDIIFNMEYDIQTGSRRVYIDKISSNVYGRVNPQVQDLNALLETGITSSITDYGASSILSEITSALGVGAQDAIVVYNHLMASAIDTVFRTVIENIDINRRVISSSLYMLLTQGHIEIGGVIIRPVLPQPNFGTALTIDLDFSEIVTIEYKSDIDYTREYSMNIK